MILFESDHQPELSPTELLSPEWGLVSIALLGSLSFEWDRGNIEKIYQKHALLPEVVEQAVQTAQEYLGLFAQPRVMTEFGWESRYYLFVKVEDTYLKIVFTFRRQEEKVVLRPISAHPIRQKEVYRVIRKQTALQWRQG